MPESTPFRRAPFRVHALLAFFFCALFLACGFLPWLSGRADWDPLYIGQLLAFAAIGLVALIAVAHQPCHVRARVYGTVMALIATVGALLALCDLGLVVDPPVSPSSSAHAGVGQQAGFLASFVLLGIGLAASGWRRRTQG